MSQLESFVDPAEFTHLVMREVADGRSGDGEGVTLYVYGTSVRGSSRKPRFDGGRWIGTFSWRPGAAQDDDPPHPGEYLRRVANSGTPGADRLEEGATYAVIAKDPVTQDEISRCYVSAGDPAEDYEIEEEEESPKEADIFHGLVKKMQDVAYKSLDAQVERAWAAVSGEGPGGQVGGGNNNLVPLSDGTYAPANWLMQQAASQAADKARLEAELREQRRLLEKLQEQKEDTKDGGFLSGLVNVVGGLMGQKGGDGNPLAAFLGALGGGGGAGPDVVQMPTGATVGGFDPESPYSSFLVSEGVGSGRGAGTRQPVVPPMGAASVGYAEDDYDDYDDDDYEDDDPEETEDDDMGSDTDTTQELRPLARALFGEVYSKFQSGGEEAAKQHGREIFIDLAKSVGGFTDAEIRGLGPVAENFSDMLLKSLPAPSKLLVKLAGFEYVKQLMTSIIVSATASL